MRTKWCFTLTKDVIIRIHNSFVSVQRFCTRTKGFVGMHNCFVCVSLLYTYKILCIQNNCVRVQKVLYVYKRFYINIKWFCTRTKGFVLVQNYFVRVQKGLRKKYIRYLSDIYQIYIYINPSKKSCILVFSLVANIFPNITFSATCLVLLWKQFSHDPNIIGVQFQWDEYQLHECEVPNVHQCMHWKYYSVYCSIFCAQFTPISQF